MNQFLKEIQESSQSSLAQEVRAHLHEYPELSGQETKTMSYLCGMLDELGIEYTSGIAETGIVATISGKGNGRCIGLRADMDALPIQESNHSLSCRSKIDGVMHACGHDIHTAVLMGTGAYLAAHRDEFSGSVKLFFQPAEEGDGGAERMIREGCLENPHVDAVLGLHVEPSMRTGYVGIRYGKMYASSDVFTLLIHGKACHGANPELGIDAIVIASQIISSAQSIVSRNLSATDAAVCTFGTIRGGNVANQVADTVEITGIIRALTPETRSFVRERLEEIAVGTASMMGGSAELKIHPSYSPLINDDAMVDHVKKTSLSILGADHIVTEESPCLSVEDFAYFAAARPSCFYHLGCTYPDASEEQLLHNSNFDPDPDCIPIGIALQCSAVLDYLK